jgi:hypothetical protein
MNHRFEQSRKGKKGYNLYILQTTTIEPDKLSIFRPPPVAWQHHTCDNCSSHSQIVNTHESFSIIARLLVVSEAIKGSAVVRFD